MMPPFMAVQPSFEAAVGQIRDRLAIALRRCPPLLSPGEDRASAPDSFVLGLRDTKGVSRAPSALSVRLAVPLPYRGGRPWQDCAWSETSLARTDWLVLWEHLPR